MARKISKGTELNVFRGREAKLNRAIFQTLVMNGPENLYGILKQIKFFRGLKGTRHASVGKRIRILEETGFVRKAGFKKTKAGIETPIYEVTAKALIALLLDKFSLEELLNRLNESLIFQTIVTVFSEEEPKSQQ